MSVDRPARIQRSRLPRARLPEGTVCVDRSTIFGDPWAVGNPGLFNWPRPDRAGWSVEMRLGYPLTADVCVARFRYWLRTGLFDLPPNLTPKGEADLYDDMDTRRGMILSRLPNLRGKNLACYCKPGCPCHADVLMEMAND